MKYTEGEVYFSILKEVDKPVLSLFKSSDSDLNEFLDDDASEYQKLNLGITYLLLRKNDNKLLSYMTISMGALKLPEKKAEFLFRGRSLGEYSKSFPNQFPAILIGKLATDSDEEGKGCAARLIEIAVKTALEVRQRIGCSYLVAHAKNTQNVITWYETRGFRAYIFDLKGRDTIPMYLEL